MKIKTIIIRVLAKRLAHSDKDFQEWFEIFFYDLEEILEITPEEYTEAIKEKAYKVLNGITLYNFIAAVDFYGRVLDA